MTEENQAAGTVPAQSDAPALALQKLYVKDVSFETPNAPSIFNEQGQPNIKMNMNQKVTKLDNDLYEVVLTVTVTCDVNEKTAYLVEVAQAGIFTLKNFPEQALRQTLGAFCPNVLFPYVRQVVSELVGNGGFQPLTLQPVNFDQLYAQQAEQIAKAQEQPATTTKQ
ncbi:MAG: protein-export chaperone SecB [Proteobacteria bacterium]|nr:protein-export chaperone SecB [Pseudomonadota bacterium]